MADIFRKKSLDKLSSPEQLDKMIVVNSPFGWLAIAGGAFIILVVLIWSIAGRIPVSEEGNGILLNNGKLDSVYAGTEGVITKTYVNGGDEIKKGDVLFEVENTETAYNMEQIQKRIDEVEKVTFTSKDDVVTSDNQQLVSMKNQQTTMGLESEGNEQKLKELKKEYKQSKEDLKKANSNLKKAKKEYYGGLAEDNSSTIEYEYNKALTEYQTAESLMKSAEASYTTAKSTAQGYYLEWSNANGSLAQLKDQVSTADIETTACQQDYQMYQTQVQTLKGNAQQVQNEATDMENKATAAEAAALEAEQYAATAPEEEKAAAQLKAQNARIAASAARQQASVSQANAQSLQKQSEEAQTKLKAEETLVSETAAQLNSAASQLQELQNSVTKVYQQYCLAADQAAQYSDKYKKAVADCNSKKSTYEDKKAAYENYIHNIGPATSQKTEEGNEYNIALTEYNTQKTKKENLENEIKTLELQVSLGETSDDTQMLSLEEQFDVTKESILDSLNTEYETYEKLSNGSKVKADADGVVYSTLVSNGNAVGVDTEVARISEKGETTKLQAVYFMSLDSGKNVKTGMKVNIYANTLAKEEYGHMTGTVVSVANYVTSYADMYNRLGDSTLAQMFGQNGSVVEVVCDIKEDGNTVSGFDWTSKKGKTAELSEGTLLTGNIVTESVAPITMLIPKLKEIFHLG